MSRNSRTLRMLSNWRDNVNKKLKRRNDKWTQSRREAAGDSSSSQIDTEEAGMEVPPTTVETISKVCHARNQPIDKTKTCMPWVAWVAWVMNWPTPTVYTQARVNRTRETAVESSNGPIYPMFTGL